MRRALVTMLAVPALLLSACSGDDDTPTVQDETTPATTPTSAEETTSEAPTSEETMTEEETTTEAPTTDEMTTTTEAPDTDSDTATEPSDSDSETATVGAEGSPEEQQAVADRTEEWLVAFVNGDEEVCDLMLDLSGEGPMKDSEDYEICTSMIPPMAEDMFTDEMVGIIESMQIEGATVNGDTAIVGRDNFSEMFAEGIGDSEITLKKVDDEWYVDLENSFNE